jgi:hypothetical protein
VSGVRVVAVCGYSGGGGLHPICERRLRRAEQEARPDDVVLLSGWARGSDATSEAELMADSWTAACFRLHVDRHARSTRGNVAAAAALVRAVDADEVVLVTSGWHARRAGALLRAALRGSGVAVRVATTDERPSLATRAREVVCWTGVPLAVLRRKRNEGIPAEL